MGRGQWFVSCSACPVHLPAVLCCAVLCRDSDLEVNPTREKALTNVRAAGADEKVFLTPPRLITLEDAIG